MCLYLVCKNLKLLTESKNVIFLSLLFLCLPCLWQATFISCYQENAIWSNLGANCSHLPNLIMCFVNQALRRSTQRWQMMSNIWLEKRLLYKLGDSGPESRWPIRILQYFEPPLTEKSEIPQSKDSPFSAAYIICSNCSVVRIMFQPRTPEKWKKTKHGPLSALIYSSCC